ncbi:MAG TPA: ABC transporter substrate-binding protein [Egibacteraceae bacterium]|nr:ABC transporter substrate-binding protein [Egibacteraceae bacterium]
MGQRSRPRLHQLAAGVALCLLAVACVPQGSPQEPEPSLSPLPAAQRPDPLRGGGTLSYAIQEPTAIVPPAAMTPSDLVVVDALFDSLTAFERDMSVIEAAAVTWEPEPGLTEWTFHLRDGARFHDQSPVTAADFKFAWEQAIGLDRSGYLLWMVDGYEALRDGSATTLRGVDAIDELTLRIRLSTPYAELPAVLAHPALGPIPRHAWEAAPEEYQRQPIGNGPFQATEPWAKDKFIRVARFNDWPNGAPAALQEVLFRSYDVETAFVAFREDLVQFTTLPAGALSAAVERYGESVDGYTGPGVLRGDVPVLYYLGFNVARPPFDDPEVRRAISKAIDRDKIADANLDGNLRVARSAVPRGIRHAAPPACGACAHLPDEARAIFEDREITEMELWFNGDGGHEGIAESIRADLAAVGVRLRLREVTYATYLSALRRGTPGMFRFGWVLDHPTADNILTPLFRSAADSAELSANYGGYASEEVDELLDRARRTALSQVRAAHLREAERIAVGQDMAVVPIVTLRHSAVVSDRVDNFYYSPLGLPNLDEVRLRPPSADRG